MGLYNNVPTFTYVSATGITVTYNDKIYTVQSFYTNKKYIYWDSDNGTVLQASNTMPTRSTKTHLVLINDNGIVTAVPSTSENFEISYDGDSDDAIRSRIYALYQKDKELGDKYIAIEQDVDGIKQFIGSSDGEDFRTLVDKVSKIEQTSDDIQLSVSNIKKIYEDDKEMSQLREDLNSAIITLNSDLGTFNSEIQDYYKDDKISNEEKIAIETMIDEVSSSKSEVLKHVNTVILIASEAGNTTNLIALNSAVEALNNAHTNLVQNISVAISDSVIVPSEKTVIIDGFAKYNLRITELKNLCDDIIFLGVGGVIIDELSKIGIKSNEIKLSVSSVESSLKSDLSVQKLELGGQINDISNSLNTFKDTVNTTFRDGLISEAEKSLLQEKIANMDKEKLDIDTRYNSIVNDTNLYVDVKSDLVKKYEAFNQKHTELKSKIEHIISDDMVNDAEKLEVNALFDEYSTTLASLSVIMTEAIENILFNSSQKEIQKAKDDLRNEIDDVKNSIDGIDKVLDGTFENNILDEVERENIKQNLDNLSREKLDIDKTYSELYNNVYLTGQDKVDLKNKYDNYISKYNNVVSISEGILAKEELVNNVDKANIENAVIKHNEAISAFHTYANKSIDVIATNKVNSVKGEITSSLNNLRSEVEGLNEYVDNTFKNNIIDEAERNSISQNIETLNREKADIDKTYEVIYSNTYLDGQLKTNLKNSYDTFVSKHSETLNVIQAILDKDTLINDVDRENMSNSFSRLNEALSNLISNINKASEYITLKSVEAAKSELQSQIKNTNDKIDNIIADVEGVIADGIIEEAETMVIAENINRLNKEKLELDTKYDVIYNNSDLDGNIKVQLANAKSDFNNKFSNVITVINTIVEDNEITGEEKETFQSSINSYNTSFANLVKQLDLCVDYIANKKVDNASSLLTKELQELQGALDGLEDTMNTTFKDGILSEAEKNSISQNLKTLETSKLNIDKQYNVVYNNASLTGTAKTELKTSYDDYISKYNSLVAVINNILNKEGLLVEADKTNLNNAFKNHNNSMSAYNEKVNKAIDSISAKKVSDAKNELSNNINELNSALSGLENNMNNAFKDGVLSEAEKTSIKQHLLSVSSEKSDIDKRYAALYSNTNLVGTPKTNLTTAYNNYVSAYNSLVTVINNILEKEGLIDSTDQANLDNAFKEHDSKLGLYSTADLNAIDAIAKKKVEDSEEKTNKKIAEIVVTSDSITQRVESVEKTTTTLTTNINTVTNTANNSVKSVEVLYYLSTSQTSLAGGSWSTTAPTWVNGKYMWSKTKTTLSNGTIRESQPTCIAGAKGDTGASGSDGKGVKSITNYYLASSSSTGVTTSTSGWTTEVQSPSSSKKYLWNYEKITYTDNSSTSTTPCIIGNYSKDGINGTNGTNGTNGKDGKGIVSITEYYLVSPNATGVTTSTSGWNTTIPSMTSTNRYLWNYEKTAYTTGEVETGNPKVIGVYGDKGDTGASGTNGVGISKIENFYLASTSNSGITTSTSGWTTTVQSVSSSKKYLWNYEKVSYTNNTSMSTEPCIIGAYGDKGANGTNGTNGTNGVDGVGIKSITEYYLVSPNNSGITTSTSGWTTTIQTMTATNKYLWNYEVIAYTDSTSKTISPRIIGAYGDKGATGNKGDKGDTGATGATGQGVSSITPEYYLSTSKTTQTGGSWVTTPPTWVSGKYMWTRNKIVYKDPTSTVYTTPVYDSSLETLNTEVTTTKNKVATIETNVGSITSKVSNLETTTTTLNGSVTSIDTRLKTAEQKITDEAITSVVSDTFATKESVSQIEQRADSIELSVSGKVDSSSIISSINLSPEIIKINADKVNITGYVTFNDLKYSGTTTINGSNITTGTINANLANIININATNIVTGTLNANLVNVTNLNASNITTGTLSGNRITGGVIEGVTLKTVEPSTSGGVWIKKDGLQLGSTTFHYVNDKFKIEATQNVSISTMDEIHIMAGLKSDGTPDTTKERLINLSGKVTCNSLYVNGVQITGNGGVAVFG